MNTDFDNKRRKAYAGRRSIMDIGMGAVIAAFGVFFASAGKLGVKFTIDNSLRYAFAGLCFVYGAFRIYRGVKKNYFQNEE
jgi:hypothetical protein